MSRKLRLCRRAGSALDPGAPPWRVTLGRGPRRPGRARPRWPVSRGFIVGNPASRPHQGGADPITWNRSPSCPLCPCLSSFVLKNLRLHPVCVRPVRTACVPTGIYRTAGGGISTRRKEGGDTKDTEGRGSDRASQHATARLMAPQSKINHPASRALHAGSGSIGKTTGPPCPWCPRLSSFVLKIPRCIQYAFAPVRSGCVPPSINRTAGWEFSTRRTGGEDTKDTEGSGSDRTSQHRHSQADATAPRDPADRA